MGPDQSIDRAVAKAGTIPQSDFAEYTGLELMQRLIDGHYPGPPIAAILGYSLTEASEGCAVFRGTPTSHHLNPSGHVHGGWAATVLDSALGCAVHTTLEKGQAYSTAEFKVNLVRPITPQTGEIICEGRVVHRGRSLAVSEATLKDTHGKLLAMGTETCAIFPLRNG